MSGSCRPPPAPSVDPGYGRILWIALIVNAAMFAVEVASGIGSGSVSLLADAIDFFGDASNYALSLAVLAMAAAVRSRAALFKAACMALFGVLVLARVLWVLPSGSVPSRWRLASSRSRRLLPMSASRFCCIDTARATPTCTRSGICSRNDAIGNVAVGLAALGVFGT